MRVMLTSCGLETEKIKDYFLKMLNKSPQEAKALFIPVAAVDPGAIEVLPKCMNDLLKVSILPENITVFDLHENMDTETLKTFDVVYFCGGRTSYLLSRINDTGFNRSLMEYIYNDGFVIGVSAGSIIFANNLTNNLGLIDTKLDVHCDETNLIGKVSFPIIDNIRLSNNGAIILKDIPGDVEIIDG